MTSSRLLRATTSQGAPKSPSGPAGLRLLRPSGKRPLPPDGPALRRPSPSTAAAAPGGARTARAGRTDVRRKRRARLDGIASTFHRGSALLITFGEALSSLALGSVGPATATSYHKAVRDFTIWAGIPGDQPVVPVALDALAVEYFEHLFCVGRSNQDVNMFIAALLFYIPSLRHDKRRHLARSL